MNEILEVAKRAARVGGDVVAKYFKTGVEMRGKQSYNLVSDADVQSEQAIVDLIRKAFPAHEVLGEEESHANLDAEHLWIVDPLDGTNNFAHQIPHFAVSVAYYHQGQAQVGVVWNPVRHDEYWATRDGGAFTPEKRLQVASATKLTEVLIGCGFFYDRGAMMEATLRAVGDLFRAEIHGIRRFGTASLDLCQVASGSFGGFFEYELAPWDFAAGRLILEEAGGQISTCRGGELPIEKTDLLASNGHLHPALLEIVERHCPR